MVLCFVCGFGSRSREAGGKTMKRFSRLWVGIRFCGVPCVSCQVCALFYSLWGGWRVQDTSWLYRVDFWFSFTTVTELAGVCKQRECNLSQGNAVLYVGQRGPEAGLVSCAWGTWDAESKCFWWCTPPALVGSRHGMMVKLIQISSPLNNFLRAR